ncbi:MAG: mobile mystery protein B [Coriobacteriia bacterium]|nr:mobile mystery protein B [Coriobacteriia bacterium]
MSVSSLFDEPTGATPIDPDDAKGLIPTWVATRGDLNNAEQENIARAIAWTSSRGGPQSVEALLSDEMLRALHKRMFGDVWRWAGTYRQHETNLGAPWLYVPTQVRELLADVRVQTSNARQLPWPADELAVRFHHRLVAIHPFPNGNGRHARLAADLLVELLGEQFFSWGARDLNREGAAREAYLDALRRADRELDYGPLLLFARS